MSNKVFRARQFQNRTKKDCVLCAIGTFLQFALFVGLFPATFTCRHTKKFLEKEGFKVNYFATFYSILIGFIFAATICCYIYLMFDEYQENKMMQIKLFSESLYYTGAIIVVLSHALKVKCRILELSSWSSLLTDRMKIGFPNLLTEKQTLRIRRLSLLQCFILTLFFTFLISLSFTNDYNEFGRWTVLRRFVTCLAGLTQGTSVFLFNLEGIVFLNIFQNCYSVLEKTLANNLEGSFKMEFNKELRTNRNCLKVLRDVQKLHYRMFYSYKYISAMISPYFLMWVVLLIATLIFSCYIFVKSAFEDRIDTFAVVLEFRVAVLFGIIIYLLWRVEQVAAVVSNFIVL